MAHQFFSSGTVCTPAGFQACGVKAGLKQNQQPDLALLYSEVPAVAAAAFTTNLFAAAPVIWDRGIISAGQPVRAVVVNSGNANACTGEAGLAAAEAMARQVADELDLRTREVLVSSTGRIGVQMPMDCLKAGISQAARALSSEGGEAAAEAIITTDTRAKHCACQLHLAGKRISIGGMTKGAGMIAPRMRLCLPPQATMLAYITTDARIEREALAACLGSSLDQSFNRIIVDGDTSTNDTVIALANGLAGNPVIRVGSPEAQIFQASFAEVLSYLAKEMVLDGEGVTHFVELNISGTANDSDARQIAEAIARSPLCKTAWFGHDPNWGRILAAAGYSGVVFEPAEVDLDYQGLPIVRNGQGTDTPEEKQSAALREREIRIDLRVGSGEGKFTIWTCDLSYDYVKINADYHT